MASDIDPATLSSIYRSADCGSPATQVELFDDVLECDSIAANLYAQRRAAVAGRPWTIVAGGPRRRDVKAAMGLHEAMTHVPDFGRSVDHLLGSTLYGYAASEIEWTFARRARRVVPARFHDVSPWHFDVTTRDELMLRTLESPAGESLAPGSWIAVHRPGSVPLARRGLGRATTRLSVIKLLILHNRVAYVVRHGIPYLTVRADQYSDQVSREIAEDVLATYGEDGGAVLPADFQIDVHDGARSESDLHEAFLNYLDAQNTKAINGVELATSSGGTTGTRALGQVHAQVRWEAILADAAALAEAFVECVSTPYVAWNELDAAPPSIVFHIEQHLSPGAFAELAALARNKLGLPISAQQMRERLGLRPPVDEADALDGGAGRPVDNPKE